MYKVFFHYPDDWQWKYKPTERETAEALKTVKEFAKANAGQAIEMNKSDEGTFMTRMTYMVKDDPCFCGSGKKLINCCITEEQFNEAVKTQTAGRSIHR